MAYTQNYIQHLQSDEWKSFRKRIISRRKHCEYPGCKESRNSMLNLHHKSYKHLGAEQGRDVMLLCKFHHAMVHPEKQPRINKAIKRTIRGAKKKIRGWLERIFPSITTMQLDDYRVIIDALTCYLDYLKAEGIDKRNPDIYREVAETIHKTYTQIDIEKAKKKAPK